MNVSTQHSVLSITCSLESFSLHRCSGLITVRQQTLEVCMNVHGSTCSSCFPVEVGINGISAFSAHI
jgi:hypothetical protein